MTGRELALNQGTHPGSFGLMVLTGMAGYTCSGAPARRMSTAGALTNPSLGAAARQNPAIRRQARPGCSLALVLNGLGMIVSQGVCAAGWRSPFPCTARVGCSALTTWGLSGKPGAERCRPRSAPFLAATASADG